MRQRFDQEIELGRLLISETPIMPKSRHETPALVASLIAIYKNEEYSNKIFDILEDKIMKGKKRTGRLGLNLWQIFVLAELRLTTNSCYDTVHFMVNTNSVIRQLLGIESKDGFPQEEISYQRIKDNVRLLDEDTLKKINAIIVDFGHKEVFKKKEMAPLCLKTDSYVVESNVHFPTDYNLLWDSSRKCLDVMTWFMQKNAGLSGWRKLKDWRKSLKSMSRVVGKTSGSGGKNKQERLEKVVREYLIKGRTLVTKIKSTIPNIPIVNIQELSQIMMLEEYIKLVEKHIDLLERRIIKKEIIPHSEKLFSIFEQYTEWITKGKKRPNVEFGKRLSITTDQYGLIVDYEIQEERTDSEVVLDISVRVLKAYEVKTWSFDKGYWNPVMKSLLDEEVAMVIMPKKGKRNKVQEEEETNSTYKKIRKKHSAVESNVNELEHRGLDRCPDRGYHGYKRYIGMGIVSYNLHRVGKKLLAIELDKQKAVEKQKKYALLKQRA
jgi:hypothetical protein